MAEKKNQDTKAPVSDVKAKGKAAPDKKVAPAKAAAKNADAPAKAASPDRYRLKKKYIAEVAPALFKEFNYSNVNEVPRLVKITLNMRLGDVKDNSKSFNIAVEELAKIAGQKPVVTKAKKSVANFKVRQNMSLGAKVTLRGAVMYEFMDKLVSIALPRVRDFRGISDKSFDGRGNYAMGIREQIIFPEISYDLVEKIRGFDVCFVTTAKTDAESKSLLQKMGMPFKA